MSSDNNTNKYFYGTGRRKSAVARVRLYPGETSCQINEKDIVLPKAIIEPLSLTGKVGKYGIKVKVSGGGFSAQLMAVRLGIARALLAEDPGIKSTLKKSNLLTRDSRETERKKPGLKKARRAPQWSKR